MLAIDDDDVGTDLQELLSTDWFRVYRNTDVVGCELAGALKNVVAIAAGMAEGLGTGDNTKAAVMTRGLAELSRLGSAMGGNPLTFSGLAGLGDLVATCASPLSRNRLVGEQLGRGRPAAEVLAGDDRAWPRASPRPPWPSSWRPSTASRCRSPRRSPRSSPVGSPRRRRTGACSAVAGARSSTDRAVRAAH